MGRKFFEGIQFKPKDAAIGCLVMSLAFFMSLKTEFSHYQYYVYEQPSYQDLTVIKGVIIGDPRKPPRPYNKREDGIYVDTGDKKINIYCDNPKETLIGYGTNGGGSYDLGQCSWIAAQRSRSGLCDKTADDKFCRNPRYFFGDKITARISDNHTIYELYVNGKAFYKYDEMVLIYKNKLISNIRSNFIFAGILVLISIICWILHYRSKSRNKMV